ncbi:hypothetical protein ACOQFL_07890 [Actinopolyspora sp. H202]
MGNNSDATRLGFACLLKFFEIEANYAAVSAEDPSPYVRRGFRN